MAPINNNDPAYAHDLYADLRELDHALDADIILVEALPTTREWQGVADRLRRAAFDSQGVAGDVGGCSFQSLIKRHIELSAGT